MTLLLGCGRTVKSGPEVVTLDADARLAPDVVCTLGVDPLPFADDSVDDAIAIHVLEHIGRQGETAAWFQFWEELYRVLKPGGTLTFESPLWNSVWSWADPSHTRALSAQAFCFFDQDAYRIQSSPISPYRIRCDFQPVTMRQLPDVNLLVCGAEAVSTLSGVLVARKPLRPWWEAAA